jgi:hypothetical protein
MGYIKNASRTSLGDSRTTVADALFTATRQRVLAVLFGNPGRSFYANEIIRLAAAGTGAVQRELTSLASADLLTVKAVGNQKHFQANASAPVFASLRDIVLNTSGDTLAYGELFSGLEASAKRLGRTINPTLYSRQEFDKRMRAKQTFIVRVLAQPKIWIVGSEHDLAS